MENESAQAASGYKVDVRVYDQDKNYFVNGVTVDVPEIAAQGSQSVDVTKYVENPELWSAEHPNLYYMFYDLIWYFKDHDSTRPVHSESSNDANGTALDGKFFGYGGDSAQLMLYVAVLAAAVCGLTAAVVIRRRRG